MMVIQSSIKDFFASHQSQLPASDIQLSPFSSLMKPLSPSYSGL